MGYQPIENYGIIGDMHSVALVGTDGSIDWLCFPHFDSPSVFAAILDAEKGGRFKISPLPDGVTRRQLYWPDTNVLLTRFLSPDGVGEITDYMPVGKPAEGHGHHQLIRRVKVVRGSMTFRTECFPAFDYARDSHETEVTAGGACFHSLCQPGARGERSAKVLERRGGRRLHTARGGDGGVRSSGDRGRGWM